MARAPTTTIDRATVNRFVGGLTEFPFVENRLYCRIMNMKYLCPEIENLTVSCFTRIFL